MRAGERVRGSVERVGRIATNQLLVKNRIQRKVMHGSGARSHQALLRSGENTRFGKPHHYDASNVTAAVFGQRRRRG
jgi:hypothetical protein